MSNDNKELWDKYLQKFHDLAIWIVLLLASFYLWHHPDLFKKLLRLEKPPEKVKVEEKLPRWEGTALVTEVIDGATVQIQTQQNPTVTVRLAGIDAPIISRNPLQPGQPLAEESKSFLEQLVKDRAVTMAIYAVDEAARRPVVVLTLDNEAINVLSLKSGLSELSLEFLRDLPDSLRADMEKAQSEARSRSQGIWGLAGYESPAAYRIRAAHQRR
jgi:endonuclease YncB( thermonuclease family)